MTGPEFKSVITSSWRPMTLVAMDLGISRRTLYNYFVAEIIPDEIVERMARAGYNLSMVSPAEPDWKTKYYELLGDYNAMQKVVQNLTKKPRKPAKS